MTNEVNVVDHVWQFLDGHPCIRMDMTRDIVNSRALARYIIKKRKINTSVDAVMSAMRRYDFKTFEEMFENALKIISKSTAISTKSPLADISVVKDTEVQRLLPKLFSIIDYNRGDALRVIQADESIKILVDEKNLEKVKSIFPEKKIITINRNLAEINVHSHPDAYHVPGILAVVSNKLAIHGINIVGNMSCSSEWLWFVEEKDVLKTYNILYQLWHKELE